MSRLVCYLPSYNDSELVAQSLATVPDWDVVISDNASDPAHAAALDRLAGPRVQIIHQPRQLGRVGNWRFCVEHFLSGGAGGASWMKFLLAGDRHKPDSLAICERAIAQYPDIRSFVFNVEIHGPDGIAPWSAATGPLRLSSDQSLLQVVQRGNVFYGLLAALFHADTVRGGFSFGADILSYCADMFFQARIARRWPTLFYPEVVAEFVAAHRKMYSVSQFSLEHLVEEVLVKLRAADDYAALTGDRQSREQMAALLAGWLRGGLEQSPEKLIGRR
ncbi:MAG: glycosyltransferase [Pirellulales bacterium]